MTRSGHLVDRRAAATVAGAHPHEVQAAALKRLASDFTLLKTLESHVVAPRGMGDVAAEMIGLYAALAPTSSRTTPTISSVA